jgi:hypothetical protein
MINCPDSGSKEFGAIFLKLHTILVGLHLRQPELDRQVSAAVRLKAAARGFLVRRQAQVLRATRKESEQTEAARRLRAAPRGARRGRWHYVCGQRGVSSSRGPRRGRQGRNQLLSNGAAARARRQQEAVVLATAFRQAAQGNLQGARATGCLTSAQSISHHGRASAGGNGNPF